MKIEELYTPLEEAKVEIMRRWNDKELRKKVEKFLNGDIPKFLKKEPRAALVRDVVSPNNELFYFLDIAELSGIKPIFIEYKAGKFVAKNLNKYHLCNMYFYHGLDKNCSYKIDHERVVDFNKMEGQIFAKMKTVWNNKFIDFHHNILHKSLPGLDMNSVVDFSKWFKKHRGKDNFYYLDYLALFLCHGILFDNFIMNNNEKEFIEKKVFPSFEYLTKFFGVKPLIVPITPIETECDLWSWLYPGEVKEHIKNKK